LVVTENAIVVIIATDSEAIGGKLMLKSKFYTICAIRYITIYYLASDIVNVANTWIGELNGIATMHIVISAHHNLIGGLVGFGWKVFESQWQAAVLIIAVMYTIIVQVKSIVRCIMLHIEAQGIFTIIAIISFDIIQF
jgi:hypothetical protein